MSAAENDAPWTIARLLDWTQDYLQRHAVESARLCAEILLAHAMDTERLRLYTQHDQAPGREVLDRFRELVRQAGEGHPIAHLTGSKEFFSLSFAVTPDVLIPRPESEILVERTISLVRKDPDAVKSLLDLGTGSGCLAVALARHLPQVQVGASDLSEVALAVAQQNAARHDVAPRIEFRAGDLFAPWNVDGPRLFDVIVCNPPYVATENAPIEDSVREHEPHTALFAGRDGLDVMRRLLADAPAHLRAGGHLLVEMAYDQAEAVRGLLDERVWQDAVTYRDAAGHERVLHVRRRAAENVQVA